MFGCNVLGDGNSPFTGNIVTVTGQGGTITEGMSYGYLYQQGPDSYVDYISVSTGTIIFQCQGSLGRAVLYGGSSNNYKAIHSTFIFGALRDGANTKNELMAAYLSYFPGGKR